MAGGPHPQPRHLPKRPRRTPRRGGTPPVKLGGARIVMGGRVVDTKGRHGIRSLVLADSEQIPVDCLAVSGGWNPNGYLTCHKGGRPIWNEVIAAFVPGRDTPFGMTVAGSAGGTMTLAAALKEGRKAGNIAANELGYSSVNIVELRAEDEDADVSAFWYVKESSARSWLDLQNDVTV